VNDRDRQDIDIALFHRHDLVDERAHRLARCRKDIDHTAIKYGHHRLDAAFERIDGDAPEILGAIDEVRMREFLEIDEEIRGLEALFRQMAVRVKFGADENLGADDLAHARQEIAFRILVTICDHGAMQPENDGIDRHRGPQLVEDFVAQVFIGAAVHQPGRIGPGGGTLDHVPSLFRGNAPPHSNGCGTKGRRFGMHAGRGIERGFEGAPVDADGGEGIRLGREGRRENAQCFRLYSMGFGR
jgi:hypothetical protein